MENDSGKTQETQYVNNFISPIFYYRTHFINSMSTEMMKLPLQPICFEKHHHTLPVILISQTRLNTFLELDSPWQLLLNISTDSIVHRKNLCLIHQLEDSLMVLPNCVKKVNPHGLGKILFFQGANFHLWQNSNEKKMSKKKTKKHKKNIWKEVK